MLLKPFIIAGDVLIFIGYLWIFIKSKEIKKTLLDLPDEVLVPTEEIEKLKKITYTNMAVLILTIILSLLKIINLFQGD